MNRSSTAIPKGGKIYEYRFSGKVLDTAANTDESTLAIAEFNEKIQRDERVSNILPAVRDGLMIVRKEKD